MIDPHHALDPRVIDLSDGAARVYLSSLFYCWAYRTGGRLPTGALLVLRARQKHRNELEGKRLWQTHEGNLLVTYCAEQEARRLEVEARRDADRLRQFKHRSKGTTGCDVTPDVTPPVTGSVTLDVTPMSQRDSSGLVSPTPPSDNLSDLELFPDPDLPVSSPENLSGSARVAAKRVRKRVSKKGPVEIPEDWKPTDEHRKRAAESRLDLEFQAAKFRSHHEAKGSLFVSWNAAFTTWLMNAPAYAPRPNGPPPGASEHESRTGRPPDSPPPFRGERGELKPISADFAALAQQAAAAARGGT